MSNYDFNGWINMDKELELVWYKEILYEVECLEGD